MSLLDPVLHRLRAAGPNMTRHSATGHRGFATPPTGPSAASSAHGSRHGAIGWPARSARFAAIRWFIAACG